MMKFVMHTSLVAALTGLLLPSATMAQTVPVAGDPGAALGECFVMKSTGQDRVDLVTWMTIAFASSPKLKGVVTIEPGKKVAADKAVAHIFTRLFTVDCQTEAKAVMQLPNSSAVLHEAGGRLGMIAAQDLFSDPQANAALADFTQYLDKQAFVGLKP